MIFSGFSDLAEYYLNKFKWGRGFLSLNDDLLNRYARCSNGTEIIQVQNDYLQMANKCSAEKGNQSSLKRAPQFTAAHINNPYSSYIDF